MIVLTDSNCAIQTYFILGLEALKSSKAPELQLHPYVRDELVGLGKNKPHLKAHWQNIMSVFPVAKIITPQSHINDEREYLEAQFDVIKQQGKVKLGDDPSIIDLTQLAVAKINGYKLATLEHSLYELGKIVHAGHMYTLWPIVEMFFEDGMVTKQRLQENLDAFPKEELLRKDDAKKLGKLLSQ